MARGRAAAAWEPLARDAIRRGRWRRTRIVDVRTGGRAAVWPASQVIAAALHLHLLDPGAVPEALARDLLGALDAYRVGSSYAPWPGDGDRYLDDNAWVGLDLVLGAEVLADVGLRAAAAAVAAFVGAHEDPRGGMPWRVAAHAPRNTCSTAPSAALGAWLALLGADPGGARLAMAERLLAWLDSTLRAPSGTYWDHIDDDGTVDRTLWSYNQGSVAGALVVLGRALDDRSVQERGAAVGRAALAVLSADLLWSQPPVFNAICFRNLLAVDAAAGVPGVRERLEDLLERGWARARDAGTGWFTEGGVGRYDAGGTIDQAGWVQLYALAALPPRSLSMVT